ncbi:MAG: hypothetical protein M3R43_07530 [Acidobacteriota bacterium]|nr:hypothetical protein [Acidobacteriota bacterium]
MPQLSDEIVRANGDVRGTQSFVHVMAAMWRRPSLTALEVLWRWLFGVGAMWLLATQGWRVWLAATQGTANASVVNLDHFTIMDPIAASERLAAAFVQLLPPVLDVARWLVPLLLAAWVVVSAIGRTVVLRRMEPSLPARRTTLMALGAVRVVFLAATFGLWLWMLRWCGGVAVTGPAARGEEPKLVAYFALVIVGTLLIFVVWAMVSWVLSIAPLLVVLHGLDAWESLRAATKLGLLRGKLIEINLVMGIVKIALVVLAMVFSATPLPFQAFTTQGFLWVWWTVVTVLYLVASDFFHVVRMAVCLALCRAYGAR